MIWIKLKMILIEHFFLLQSSNKIIYIKIVFYLSKYIAFSQSNLKKCIFGYPNYRKRIYKMVKIVHSSKQAFTIADTFLRESTICCLPSRMNFLDLLAKTQVDDKQIQAAIYRVMGFYQYFMPHVTEFYMASYNGKVEEMKEY